MSEEEKKAIEYIKNKIKNKLPKYEEEEIDGEIFKTEILQLDLKFNYITADKCDILLNLIEKKQKEIEKQNKIIDLMAEQLTTDIHSKEWVKKYYNSKVLD